MRSAGTHRSSDGVKAEERWRGVAVSEGSTVGRVLRIHSDARQQVYRAALEESEVEHEVDRFRAAMRLARRQLRGLKRRAELALGAEHAYIFEAHLLMLQDRKLRDDVEGYVRRGRVNAEWAVKVVADHILAVYAEVEDGYLRERSADVEDVMQRILVALSGKDGHGSRLLPDDAVIVAEELMPSVAAELDLPRVRAIASDAGGWTSHTAIIARGLGIPAVVGLRDMYRRARTGDEIIVDASTGEVVLHPSPQTLELYRTRLARMAVPTNAPASVEDGVTAVDGEGRQETLHLADGGEVFLRANVELPAEYEGVRRYGARGIGLYRSEFLLTHRSAMPAENEQFTAYVKIAELAGVDGASVRMFDLGGDKTETDDTERNPALGLRAIRFCLRREDVMRAQVRAVLRAAAHGNLQLVLPMISDISEVRRARRVINEEREQLTSEGHATGEVKIGAMIEVPSAVLVADKLAREVDFFSLGTNDLVQYTLAVDRGNDEVADWFRSLHPAVLRSIDMVMKAARAAAIPVVVCGEMAATPVYACVLVGLGVRDLSMTASAIPRMRRVIAGIDAERAGEVARECLECATADDVEELVRVRLAMLWPHLFPPETLPVPIEVDGLGI